MPTPFAQTTRSLDAERRRGIAVAMLLGAALLGGWMWWFADARVAIYVPGGPARVELDRPGHPIQVEVGGRLVSSALSLDRPVEAGEILVQLDDRALRLSRAEEEARLAALRSRRASRAAEREARAAAEAPAAAADAAAIAEARARLDAARAARALARAEARRAADLRARAVAPAAEAERLDAAARQAAADVRELEQQVARLAAEKARAAADRAAALAGLDTELAGLDGEIAQAAAHLDRLAASIDAMAVRAPVSGRVAELRPRGAGAVLAAGDALGTIIGEGTLRIVARLPVDRALGRVRPGQRAILRVDGFPWTRYGTVPATVTRVAAEGTDGWLRIELAPAEGTHDVPLQHGLTGRVEIEVERVRPIEMLLATLGRALEPDPPAAEP